MVFCPLLRLRQCPPMIPVLRFHIKTRQKDDHDDTDWLDIDWHYFPLWPPNRIRTIDCFLISF